MLEAIAKFHRDKIHTKARASYAGAHSPLLYTIASSFLRFWQTLDLMKIIIIARRADSVYPLQPRGTLSLCIYIPGRITLLKYLWNQAAYIVKLRRVQRACRFNFENCALIRFLSLPRGVD